MKWPSEEVSENGAVFPEGLLTVKVVGQRDGEAKNGQARIEVQTRILKPAQFRGQPYNFNFVIGVTADTAAKLGLDGEDLAAEEEATWKANPSARRYKTMLKKAGVPDTGDTEEEAEAMKGRTIGIFNEVRDGKYNEAARFYSESEAEATAPTKAVSAKPSANGNGNVAPKAAPKATPKAAPAADAGDEAWDA